MKNRRSRRRFSKSPLATSSVRLPLLSTASFFAAPIASACAWISAPACDVLRLRPTARPPLLLDEHEEAVIDWTDSKFEKDPLYEDINAPQWFDFSADHLPLHDDDQAWFCRPDCDHPKTVDDFIRRAIRNSSKLQRSANTSETPPSGDQNSNTRSKKRGIPMTKRSKSTKRVVKDRENQNPNFLAPLNHHVKPTKSSTEKKQVDIGFLQREETARGLKSTFSARNLFAGRDILNQITEFCNELKRLATGTKEKEIVQKKHELGVLQKSSSDSTENLRTKKRNNENIKNSRHKNDKRVSQKVCISGQTGRVALSDIFLPKRN